MHSKHLHIPLDLSNEALVARVNELVARERGTTAEIVAYLAEVDSRRLYAGAGYPSMFVYCRDALGFSDSEAYDRIAVARAARRFPMILERLADGAVSLTAVRLLAPQLTLENHSQVLESARGLHKSQVEELLARLAPKPDVPTSIRRMPAPEAPVTSPIPAASSSPTAAPTLALSPSPLMPPMLAPATPGAVVSPLSPDRYKLQLTISGATLEKLRHVKDLLRHAHPSGDEAAIIDRALTLLLADVMKKKLGVTDRPAPATPAPVSPREPVQATETPRRRKKPRAAVRGAVTRRDDGRCAFVSADGRRCNARAFLEFHHVKAYVHGGGEPVENIELRCQQHNAYEWELLSSELRRLEDQWLANDWLARKQASAAARSGTSAGARTPSGITPPRRDN